MANVSEVITLGIGTPSSIPYLIRFGLGQAAVVFSGQTLIIGGPNPRRYDDASVTLYDTREVRRYSTNEVRKYGD